MKIMILSSEFDPFRGGIGTYAREMALAATELGHRVTVVAADYGAGEAAPSFPFRVLRYPGGQHHMRDIPAKIALVRRLARQEPAYDIVHAIDWPFYIPLALSAYRSGARCILTFHGTEVDFVQKPIRAVPLSLLRFWSGWAHYVANSHNTARRLRAAVGLAERAVRVVHPGVGREWLAARVEKSCARQRLGICQHHFVIATLGRVVPRKGHDVLAEALQRLPVKIVRRVEWHIIGPLIDQAYEAQLRRITESLGCKVVIHGPLAQDEVSLRLSAADVFCLPGRQLERGGVEGFGLVYLEAAALGLPSVAADMGGISEAIDHGESGLLVPENDPQALAQALASLLADPVERNRLSRGARHRAEASTWLRAAREIYGSQDNHPGQGTSSIVPTEMSC
jgi:phosphatidylinositol alpha-1,6-mannosyltransferase